MNIAAFKTQWSRFDRVYLSQIQYFNDGTLTLYIKEHIDGRILGHQVICTGVLGFHDMGLIGNEITYFDINELMGVQNWFYAEKVGLSPRDYIELVFIDQRAKEKCELIVGCREAVILYQQ